MSHVREQALPMDAVGRARPLVRPCQSAAWTLSLLVGVFCLGMVVIPRAAAEQGYDLTVRAVLDVVGAFRAAYIRQVLEHTKPAGLQAREEWEGDSHFLPLPAQFVKTAASEMTGLEISLIGMSPLNKSNVPRTAAESEALIKLSGRRDQRVIIFSDGEYTKGIAADLAIVDSCVECHNTHPKASRRNFQRWDLMGGIIVRLKPSAQDGVIPLGPVVPDSRRAPERMPNPSFVPPSWMR